MFDIMGMMGKVKEAQAKIKETQAKLVRSNQAITNETRL